MSDLQLIYEPGCEPERYELDESPASRFLLDRRDFLQGLGAGIVVLSLMDPATAQQETGRRRFGGGRSGNVPQEIGAWIHVGEDGRVTCYTGKVEVGQNIRTSLSQTVAEELRVPVTSVRMVMGDTGLVPFDMGTFGSQSTPQMGRQLHRVAAAAREMLIDLAADEWKVDRAGLTAADGKIADAHGRVIEYGKLTQGQRLAKAVSGEPPVTPAKDWKVEGHPAPRAEGRDFVTGHHKYPSDIKLPGMLHGKVLRAPTYGGKLMSADTSAAEAIPGVKIVRDGDFLGVVAPAEWDAARALKAIRAEWKPGPAITDKDLSAQLRGAPEPKVTKPEGEVTLVATYPIAYIAHAPLEPRAAVAQWEGEKLTVWTGTQRPFGVKGELASTLKLPEANVHVLMPDMGSGYGGKHSGEAAIEAARLARGAGKPVKLVWSREEEFTWAYFRPGGVIDIAAAARKDGTLTAWEFHNYNSGGSGIRTPYDVPSPKTEFHPSQSPLRQGSYRGLAATANHFARETHMDELAHAVGMDPLEFRLKNLKDERLRAVLQAAAKQFGWGAKAPAGHGYGLAVGTEKGSCIATCAEVAADDGGELRVVRAVSAFECGAIVNPDGLKNQVEGALVQGLGGALFEAIHFDEGKITNPRFSKYRVPRFSDLPKVEVVLLDRKDLPSAGAGETPIVCIAPAVGNAIFNATGQRLRSLPLAPGRLKA